MEWVYNDGGRAQAGFRGSAGDCVARSIAIAADLPYREVFDLINEIASTERIGSRKRGRSSARNGVHKPTIKKVMERLGWHWVPTMQIGSGCKIHLRSDELPAGRLVVSTSRHMTAVIDGIINDTHDPSRNGTRCVYGYFQKD